MISIVLFVFLIISIFVVFYLNPDIFSPVKFYYFCLTLYFFRIFFVPQMLNVYIVYSFYLVFGLFFAFFEYFFCKNRFIRIIHCKFKSQSIKNEMAVHAFFWLVLLLYIVFNLYIVELSGGLSLYVNGMHERVMLWRGMGYLLVWRKAYPVVFILYLLLSFIFKLRYKKTYYVTLLLIFLCLITFGLLSGSRGTTFLGIVYSFVIFHYSVRQIRLTTLMLIVPILLIFAVVFGAFRQGVRLGPHGFYLEKNSGTMSLETQIEHVSRVGLVPLAGIYSHKITHFQNGLTYLSAITNFVPRKLWPGKFDTGGVVLSEAMKVPGRNKVTNHSTGYLAEGVINFGYFWGWVAAFFVMSIVSLVTIFIYVKLLNAIFSGELFSLIHWLVVYALMSRLPGSLLVSEFTAAIDTLCIELLLFYLLYYCIKKLIKLNID